MSVKRVSPPETVKIENAIIVTPTEIIHDGQIVFEGQKIRSVGKSLDSGDVDQRINAHEQLVIPGLVDLHGDDLERHLYPRSEARIDAEIALISCDRQNVSAGVTTKFHAVSYEDAPDKNRSIELSDEVIRSVHSTNEFLVDHQIHARCEITDRHCVDAIERILDRDQVGLVSVMSHFPGSGQYDTLNEIAQRYRGNTDNLSLVQQVVDHRESTPKTLLRDRIKRITDAAINAGTVVASHDDKDIESIEWMFNQGVSICEYPITLEAANRASNLGMYTAMGAPNLVGGGSLWGNLAAIDAIESQAVDILCSDYHPYSLLVAPFINTGERLPKRVARVTSTPADAVGLNDRGRIQPGSRADIVFVKPVPYPVVTRVFVGGKEVYRTAE